ncbi:MAG TPA: metallophosphoesterase, partial [Armatimonadota bacterium]|nr:metallophosphoesterase [Armatimonadota bacterium]
MLFNRLKWLVILCLLMSPALGQVPDFTFIHTSDVHAPSYRSEKVIAQIPTLGEIDLTPYNVKALAPSFVVDSGDACEFGGGNGAWDAYVSYWKDVTIPVYPVLGNHDGPWFAVRPLLKKTYGGYYWSFDKFGCHFIGLDTSSPQDPRASVTREELLWLADDLKKVNPKTPVFLIVHHPITDTYYGSPYAVAQFMDMLRPYNLVAVLAGHGHNATCRKLLGVDCTDGGATCGPLPKCVPGFSIV